MASKDTVESIEDFKLAIGLLLRHLRATAVEEQQSLTHLQKSVVARLEENGPMTAADLARAEAVKPQSMSTAISQLEERGLIEKRARKDDGRQIDIKVTPKAITMRKTSRDASMTWLTDRFATLSRAEQETLFESAQIIKRMVAT